MVTSSFFQHLRVFTKENKVTKIILESRIGGRGVDGDTAVKLTAALADADGVGVTLWGCGRRT